jgi:hypothetical protein
LYFLIFITHSDYTGDKSAVYLLPAVVGLCRLLFSWCCFFYALFFRSARIALAGFLLSTAPGKAGHNGKAFGKKIRSPTPAAIAAADESMRGRFFFQNPQGLALTVCPGLSEICYI